MEEGFDDGPDVAQPILIMGPEAIFAKKLQIAIKRAGTNTRMKNYYDLFKLSQLSSLDSLEMRASIGRTFSKRNTDIVAFIGFYHIALAQLQPYWSRFIRKMKLADAPSEIKDVIDVINWKLLEVFLRIKNGDEFDQQTEA